MPRTRATPSDPFVADRIRETLANVPEDRPNPLPRATPAELLQTWKIKAAARQTRAHRKFVIEARWHPVSRPRLAYSGQPYDVAVVEGIED
jgi:hypothetical protein